MKNITYALLILATFFFAACEEQPIIIEQMPPPTDRKILIEEFSGGNCAACPSGAAQIETLAEQYGDQIVAVTMHSNDIPFLGANVDGSTYDLRTETGDEVLSYLGGVAGIPAAVFNRTKFEGEARIAVGIPPTWPGFALEELNKEPIVRVNTELTYDNTTRELTIDVEVIPLVNQAGDFRIGALITESHIIDKQNNNGTIQDDYEHNHILRTYLTEVQGDPLSSSFETNAAITKQFNYTLPAEDNGLWIAENCNVVIFVAETNSSEGAIQILQADEGHIGE